MIDGDKKLSMRYLYKVMRISIEKVKEACNDKVEDYMPYLRIIERRWKNQLCQPIHVAAYFLNPHYQYSESCKSLSIFVQKNFLDVVEKLYGDDVEAQVRIAKEIMLFRDALEGFQRPMTIAARSTMLSCMLLIINIIHYFLIIHVNYKFNYLQSVIFNF